MQFGDVVPPHHRAAAPFYSAGWFSTGLLGVPSLLSLCSSGRLRSARGDFVLKASRFKKAPDGRPCEIMGYNRQYLARRSVFRKGRRCASQGGQRSRRAHLGPLARHAPTGHLDHGWRGRRFATADSSWQGIRLRVPGDARRDALVSLPCRRPVRRRPFGSADRRRTHTDRDLRSRGGADAQRLVPGAGRRLAGPAAKGMGMEKCPTRTRSRTGRKRWT